MSELTREKKCQIAALGAKGKKAEEIAEIAKVDIEAVKALLATRNTEKTADNMSMQEKKDYAVRLYHQGKTRKEIMEITGLSKSAVYLLIPASKGDQKGKPHTTKKKPAQVNKDFEQAVDEMIAETKKEPAPAATDTSSEMKNEIKHISTNNDSIDLDVCQDALQRAEKTMITIYNTMSEAEQRAWELGEAFAEMMRARGQFV